MPNSNTPAPEVPYDIEQVNRILDEIKVLAVSVERLLVSAEDLANYDAGCLCVCARTVVKRMGFLSGAVANVLTGSPSIDGSAETWLLPSDCRPDAREGRTIMGNPNIAAEIEAVHRLFGKYPEDVLIPTKSTVETFAQLEEIFGTIAKEAINNGNSIRIKRLAEAGAYLALDMGNYVDCAHSDMADKLREAGAIAGQA